MNLYTYETFYPRKVWMISKSTSTNEEILERFELEDCDNPEKELEEAEDSTIITVYSVIDKENGDLGCLLVIQDTQSVTVNIYAHEAVHIADYICEECGVTSLDFSEGNEHYAYLVGWAAEQIENTVKEELKYGKHKK